MNETQRAAIGALISPWTELVAWTDATGAALPDTHVILANDAGAITLGCIRELQALIAEEVPGAPSN